MATEWKDITDPEELFRLHKQGWEIEHAGPSKVWLQWPCVTWYSCEFYRARQQHPNAKLLAERDQLREKLDTARGHLAAIRKNAISLDRYWVEKMADQALAATEPTGSGASS